jgi:hypothetical protein
LAIPDEFPPNDLYNYAYVLKYRVLAVHRGQLKPGEEILVAHYNPLKPRPSAADENSGKLGGNLQKFIIGREIRLHPKVMIAAQPTWGVDVGAAAQILALRERVDLLPDESFPTFDGCALEVLFAKVRLPT